MLVRNSLALTKRAVTSVLEQDIPVSLVLIDNASTDGTRECFESSPLLAYVRRETPAGVSASWNYALNKFFGAVRDDIPASLRELEPKAIEHVLVVNNDVVLRPDTYRELLADGGQFVTAVGVDELPKIWVPFVKSVRPHPDFSCFLIRRQCWEKVGPFDESMVLYASDADYHLRMHRAGIEAYTIGLPFYHYGSGTLKTADPAENQAIREQADRDRATFERKWGFKIGSEEYAQAFQK
jgi:GT2 family glycosyltransferase